MLAIFYLVTFGSLIGFTAFAYCVNELPASTVGTYAYVNPIVAVTLGALILREPLSGSIVAGGALVVAAVVLTTLRRTPKPAAPAIVPAPAPTRDSRIETLTEEPACSAR